jgi:hypothetical protein
LKELFITDFNSFLDYAIDTVNLDYLEMEIPLHFLKYFSLNTPTNSEYMPVKIYREAPKISIERFYNVYPRRKTYSVFTIKGKLTEDSYKYMADHDGHGPYFRFTKTSKYHDQNTQMFFSEQQINLSKWEPIEFKMFFEKTGNHQIYIFDKLYPFSCFTMLFRYMTHTLSPHILSELSAQGYYSTVIQKIVYHKPNMIILNDVSHLLGIWENNGLVFNFQSNKTLFHFPPYFEEQTENYYFPEFNMGDPNSYLYLNNWQNINYLNSPTTENEDFEDSTFFETNVFKSEEENSSVPETLPLLKISNSSPKISQFLLTESPLLPFENQVVDISSNPYLKNSSPETNDQNSFFEENNFDN